MKRLFVLLIIIVFLISACGPQQKANNVKSETPNVDKTTTPSTTGTAQTKCSTTLECSNGGDPIPVSANSYVKYQCLNGQCVASTPITVECTINEECIRLHGQGSICERALSNYGVCKTASIVSDQELSNLQKQLNENVVEDVELSSL